MSALPTKNCVLHFHFKLNHLNTGVPAVLLVCIAWNAAGDAIQTEEMGGITNDLQNLLISPQPPWSQAEVKEVICSYQ